MDQCRHHSQTGSDAPHHPSRGTPGWLPFSPPDGLDAPPPLFTAVIETVTELATQQLEMNAPCTVHHLDQVSEAVPPPMPPCN
jgi:hypothetical protein